MGSLLGGSPVHIVTVRLLALEGVPSTFMTSRILVRIIVSLAFALASELAFGQSLAPSPAASATVSAVAEVDLYVKVIGAALTAIATLVGLPIVLLTYRKTRAEIAKLELEASALREKQAEQGKKQKAGVGNIRVVVDQSPYTTIQVLADPRFLAPLLILLDFIFASIVLTLVANLFSIFPVPFLRAPTLTLLAAILLLPIARQVLRVRAILIPPQTEAEVREAQRQIRATGYTLYIIVCFAFLGFGILIMTVSEDSLTELGRYLGWALIITGMLLVAAAPLIKRRFDRRLSSLHSRDNDDAAKA